LQNSHSSTPQLSVFDLDHTLIAGNSSFMFCRYLSRRGILPKSCPYVSSLYYLRHQLFNLSLTSLHHKVFTRFLKGRSLQELDSHVEAFVQDEISSSLYLPGIDCLRRAQHFGHLTLILSNSPEFLVRGIARFLGVGDWRGTQYAVDTENRLSHIVRIMQGEDKAEQVKQVAERHYIEKSQITAYSDSHLDLPFLLSAGHPVAVNPSRKLLDISLARNWTIV